MKVFSANLILSLRLIEPPLLSTLDRDTPFLLVKLKLAKTDFLAVNQINKTKILLQIAKKHKNQKKKR